MKTINEYLEENSIPSVPKHKLKHNSTNLNVYIYPKPLVEDYLRLCALNDTWLGLDHSIRERQESFELPRSFRNEGERLIFLSMGTLGSNNVELMSHLCKLLAKCKHKIIVSRGHSHEMYKLAENMWGEAYLPQLEVLPLVDLVIFHGGSNTLIESLYYAKPMIVMPLFGDQHDNAQRVVEMNVGIKLNAFTVEENELLNSIECLLEDTEMAIRLKKISNCMKESKSMDALINRVEKIAKEPKIPN
ncbi:UDP-glycosyltransferase 207A1-like protein, partial [Dinothrombium tinctorium]